MPKWTLPVNDAIWTVTVPSERVLALPEAPAARPAAGALVREAIEHPLNFEPLRRALTPDDHVCVVVDDRLPHLGEMLAAILEHLAGAGIDPDAVTLLSPDTTSQQSWIDELPDDFADVKTEIHHPADRKKLAYLATTKSGERIYLAKTAVEADFVIVLSGHRFDEPGETLLVPGLCDADLRKKAHVLSAHDVNESVWLLGTPFFVRVIEGAAGGVHEVVAGFADSQVEADRRRQARWTAKLPGLADTVVAALAGADFSEVAAAIAHAERILAPGGHIILLLSQRPAFPPAMEAVRVANDAGAAADKLRATHAAGWKAAAQWADAASRAALFVAGPLERDECEELFATLLSEPGELQRLLDDGGTVLRLDDAHLMRVDCLKGAKP